MAVKGARVALLLQAAVKIIELPVAARHIENIDWLPCRTGLADHIDRISRHDQRIGERKISEIGVFPLACPEPVRQRREGAAEDRLIFRARPARGGDKKAGAGFLL